MDHIRCLIADVPQRMLSDIVNKIVGLESTIELVDNVRNVADLPLLIEQQSIDALIVGGDCRNLQQLYESVIKKHSDVLVLALLDDGRDVVVYLDDISADEILQVITSYAKR